MSDATIVQLQPDAESGLKSGYGHMLETLRGMALNSLDEAFDRFSDVVDVDLFERADRAFNLDQERLYLDAMGMLRLRMPSLKANTLAKFGAAFHFKEGSTPVVGNGAADNDGNTLELIAQDTLEEMIALDTMVSKAVESSGVELEFLTKRLAQLVGKAPSEDSNPFAPGLLCEIFIAELRGLSLDIQVRLVILSLFANHVLVLWPKLLAESNQYLVSGGVLPGLEMERRKIKKSPSPTTGFNNAEKAQPLDLERRRRRTESQRPAIDAARPVWGGRRPGVLVDEIHRALRKLEVERIDESPRPGAAISRDQLLQALREMSATDDVIELGERFRDRGLEQVVVGVLQQSKGEASIAAEDRDMIKVLDRTFRKLTAKKMVPAELEEVVVKLHLPIVTIVVADRQFIEKPNHPARRLLKEIFTVAGSFYDGADAHKDPLRREVDALIERLGQLPISPREMTKLLADFIATVEKDKSRLALREQRILEEEEAQAKVSSAHGDVRQQLIQLLAGRELPSAVVKFCEQAWCRVLFLEALRSGVESAQWREDLAAIGNLVSVVEGKNRPTVELLEPILATLRQRLEAVCFEPPNIHHWLKLLAKLAEADGSLTEAEPLLQSVRVDELSLQLPGSPLATSRDVEKIDLRALESVDALKRGVWLEFRDAESSEPLRCRLAGIVKPLSLYVFSNRRGAKVATETRQRLACKIKSGNVIVLDNSHLFEEALSDALGEIRVEAKAGQAKVGGRR